MNVKRWIARIVCTVILVGMLPMGTVSAAGLVGNITEWDAATTVWSFTDAGLKGAGGSLSNAAFSSAATVEAGVAFTYEADMALEGRSGALLFGYTDRTQPTKGFAVNIDRTQKKMKFFKFTDSSFNKDYDLTTEQIAQESYHIKIAYDGTSELKVWLDDVLRIETTGITLPTGYVGVMAHYGVPTFNNIYLRKGDLSLKNFEILTEGVTITPLFDPAVSIYGMDIAGGIDTVTLRPVKGEGVEKIYYTLKTREYKEVTKEKTEVTDTITLTKEDFINNYVNMDLILTGGDFERTVTFRINKWFTTEELAAQEYRPQFHVTPQINYMNDPNGMVYDPTDGYWHLHYQYSPQITIGQQTWGHVRSKDLVNWEQMPISLQVDDLGRIYSGSAISLTEEQAADPNIYDGIFADNKAGESRLIAFYTNAGVDGKQRQCTAYSKDHGVTWIKYNDGAAIIDNDQSISGVKFGDPKVFRIPEDDEHWYMVTCGLVQMFASSDLIHWEKVQSLYYANGETFEETPSGIIRCECPGMIPVTLEGTDEQKWIFNGCDGFYVVGDMVKDEETGYYNWIAESGRIDNENNFMTLGGSSKGDTFGKFAGMTFYEDGTGQGRVIGISFVYDGTVPADKIFKNYQTLPYEWKLTKNSQGEYVIVNAPIEEIDKLHGDLLFSAEKCSVEENENILEDTTGILFDLEAVIDLKDAEKVGFRVRKGTDQEILVSYSAADERLTVDLSSLVYKRQSGIFSKSLEMKDGKVHLRLIVDQGILEVFGNDGEASIATNALTDMDNIGMEFFVEGGTAVVDSMKIYDMKSMYSQKTYVENFGTRFSINTPESVTLGEKVAVTWSSYPSSDMSKYYLECDASLCAEQKDNGVLLNPVKAGTYSLALNDENGQTVATETIVVGTFDTNIARWNEIGGIWSITAQGLHGVGNGASNAAFFSLEKVPAGTAFTYEADMALEGRSGALLFGYTDSTQPTKGFAVNIDRTQKKMKFFKFTDSSFNKDYDLTTEQIEQESYHIKISYDGTSELKVWLDDVLRIETTGITLPAGYVGVMAHYGDPTFDNVYLHTTGSDVSVEPFETLKIEERSDLSAIISKLPQTATVVQSDGIHRVESITWNTEGLSTDTAGEFVLNGTVTNSALTVSIKINVEHRWESEYTVDLPASCGKDGSKSIHCGYCETPKADSAVSIPATGAHNYTEEVAGSRKDATCMAEGSVTKKCDNCDATTTDTLPIDPDNHTGKNHTENATDATCTAPGYTGDTVCECNEILVKGTEIPATGKHSWDKGVVTKEPTTTKEGVKTYTCSVCSATKTESIAKKKPTVNFVDVKKSDYFYSAVAWAVEAGVTTGTTKTTFGPEESCTRAQAVTFLWRAAGSPAPKTSNNPFKDVKKSDYYYKAVLWAVENGITKGTSATAFSPDEACTRGQIVTFLWRAESGKKVSASNPFKDVKAGDYYYNAVLWAVKMGVTTGTEADKFSPADTCTRGQIVTFLYRAMK